MDFVTIEELSILTGLTRRSVDRKLSALKYADPEKYNQLSKKDGKKLLYDAKELIGYLKQKVKPVRPRKSPDDKAPLPKAVVHKINYLLKKPVKRRKKPTRTERKTPEFAAKVAEQLINEPEIIVLDHDMKEDFRKLMPKDQRNFMAFSEAMHDYESGIYTLTDSLKRNGLTYGSFAEWIDKKPLFAAMYAKSSVKHRRAYNSKLQDAAKQGLFKLVTGYDKELSTMVYVERVGPDGQVVLIPTERKIIQKHVIPNPNAIMFALTNREPEDWKKVFFPGVNVPEKAADPMDQMSDAELLEIVNQAKTQGLIGENAAQPQQPTTI